MFRDHGAEDSVRAFRAARAAGVANLSADLILGWPGETRDRFLAGLHRLLDLGPDHVSLYVLEIDGKTVVAHHARAGTLHLPDDDLVADLFNEAEDLMAAAGIAAYEISNFARPGFESRHNLKYWDDGPFHAFGQSAHGFDQGVRYWNEATFGSYCAAIEAKGSARTGERVLSPRERLEEAVMTGLRVRRGIDRATFRVRHGIDVMEAFGEALGPSLKAELLVADETAVRGPPRRLDVECGPERGDLTLSISEIRRAFQGPGGLAVRATSGRRSPLAASDARRCGTGTCDHADAARHPQWRPRRRNRRPDGWSRRPWAMARPREPWSRLRGSARRSGHPRPPGKRRRC